MPVFEYRCQSCTTEFETLVRGKQFPPPQCPSCGSAGLEKLLSLPAVRSDTTRDLAMRAARSRDQRLGTERVAAQREYEANHD